MNKRPPPLSHFTAVPRALDVLLMAALSKDPAARPRDAFSFAASLRNLKRLVEEARPRQRPDNRITAAAVLDPTSAPTLPPDRSHPQSGRSVSTESISSSAPVALRNTTLVGMPVGSVVSVASRETAPTSSTPFATTHDGADRRATTNSLAADTWPTPGHDTEALPYPVLAVPIEALANADTEIQWPPERAAILSDGPQVRSLPVAAVPRMALRPLAVGALTAVAVVVIAVTASRPRWRAHPAIESSIAVSVPAVSPLPPARAQDVRPPPTVASAPELAPQPLDVPAPALASAGLSVPVVRPKPRRPVPTVRPPDRPGPGF
jgi:hypothetical protein